MSEIDNSQHNGRHGSIKVTYIGHATTLIEIDGVRLLTDPLLRNRVAHLRRTDPLDSVAPYTSVDAVLISHLHHDHCDLPSLRLLKKGTRMLVPVGAGKVFAGWGFSNAEEISVGSTVAVGGISVTATAAKHSGFRPPYGPRTETIGFVTAGSASAYYAGDTDVFPEMEYIPDGLDLALLPVSGWGPTLGKGHLNPYTAAVALQMIRPKRAIPIHWGTFVPMRLGWLNPSVMRIAPQLFAFHASQLAPEVDVTILQSGEALDVPADDKPAGD